MTSTLLDFPRGKDQALAQQTSGTLGGNFTVASPSSPTYFQDVRNGDRKNMSWPSERINEIAASSLILSVENRIVISRNPAGYSLQSLTGDLSLIMRRALRQEIQHLPLQSNSGKVGPCPCQIHVYDERAHPTGSETHKGHQWMSAEGTGQVKEVLKSLGAAIHPCCSPLAPWSGEPVTRTCHKIGPFIKARLCIGVIVSDEMSSVCFRSYMTIMEEQADQR
ncbi:hypothetical protein EDC04DRAFT_3092490 [Pisolithus marmoratus]|nr:hypothetical protein EDC04DRAFT_3092490 [Pisolithus marmoratus]